MCMDMIEVCRRSCMRGFEILSSNLSVLYCGMYIYTIGQKIKWVYIG